MIHGVMCYAYTTLLKTNVDTASLSASRLAVERDRITQTGLDGPNESVGMLRRHITDDTFTNAVHALQNGQSGLQRQSLAPQSGSPLPSDPTLMRATAASRGVAPPWLP